MLKRIQRFLAATVALGLFWSSVGTAFAAYNDVPANAWYKQAVDEFLDEGYLDESQTRFRAADNANRAEFVTLLQRILDEDAASQSSSSFNDVAVSAWYFQPIETAAKNGWLKGDGDCYGSRPCFARPAARINRAEAASLIVRAFDFESNGSAPRFPDNVAGQWYNEAIQTAADHCVLQGDTSTRRVRPADNMNRAEMVVMLERATRNMQYGVDCHAENPITAGIDEARAVSERSIEVDFTVDIDASFSERTSIYSIRAGSTVIPIDSVTLISDRAVRIDVDSDLERNTRYSLSVQNLRTFDGRVFSAGTSFQGFTEPQEEGSLSVKLSSTNPDGITVPRGAQATVLSLDLTASCDADVTVDHLTISHRGFGSRSDIAGLYAVVDGSRRSRIRTIQSGDGTTDVRFSPPLTLEACKGERVNIVAEFETSATASSEHAFDVRMPTDVSASVTDVSGSFPVRGNTFRIGTVTSGVVNLAYRTVSPNQTRVGDTNVVVGKFQLSADNVENQTIYSITLEQDGSASDGEVENIRIRRTDGTIMTRSASRTTNDMVTLHFDPPFVLRQSDKLTFEVIADIRGGASETVQFQLAESVDLFAIGSRYGSSNGRTVGSRVSIDPTTAPDTISIEAGRLTVEIDGPSQRAYTRDDDDAVLANVLFANDGDPLEIRSMYVAVVAETSTGAGLGVPMQNLISDMTIRNAERGRSVRATRLTGQNDSASDATRTYQIYRFDDLTVRDIETWHLMVDFQDNGSGQHPLRGDRFAVRICTEPTHVQQNGSLISNTSGCDFGGALSSPSTAYQMRVQGLSTGDTVGDIRPRGTISSAFHRISVPELLIAVRNQGASDTTVRGAKDIPLLRFEARAGEAKDVILNKAVFEAASGSLLNAQNYSLWADTDDDGIVDTSLERGVASRGGTITFSRLNEGGHLLPSEQTRVFEVRGDISSSPASDRLSLRFATGQNNYVEAEEADRGSALSGIQTDGVCTASTLCDILVRTEDSKLWIIAQQGNLYVRLDSTPVRSRQLLGGTSEQVMRLEFRSDSEPIVVTDLQITSSGSTASSIDRLELFREGATTPLAIASSCGNDDVLTEWQGSTVRTFCVKFSNQSFVVPANQTVDLVVHARAKTDVDGAISGETMQFFVSGQAVADNSTGSGAVRGYGQRSSGPLGANNGDNVALGEIFIGADGIAPNTDIVANPHFVVLSKITSVTNANPDANGTNVPAGRAPIGQFRFSAAQNANSRGGLNEATLSGAIFTLNASNVELDASSFHFYNKDNASVRHACTVMQRDGTPVTGTASGNLLVECSGLVASSVNTGVGPNDVAVFVLEASVTNPNVTSGTSTLQVSLQNIASRTLQALGFGFDASHIHWVDKDQVFTDFYWLDLPDTTVQSTSYRS